MNYEDLACRYAERYGIVDYDVKQHFMIYYKSYPAYLRQPRYTVKFTVDLRNGQTKSEQLKRYNKRGEFNR